MFLSYVKASRGKKRETGLVTELLKQMNKRIAVCGTAPATQGLYKIDK